LGSEAWLFFLAIGAGLCNNVVKPFARSLFSARCAINRLAALCTEVWLFSLAISAAFVQDITEPFARPLASAPCAIYWLT